jgi:hypothetical protein
MSLNESIVEDAALEWFEELGYAVWHRRHLTSGDPAAERDAFGEVVLVGCLREAKGAAPPQAFHRIGIATQGGHEFLNEIRGVPNQSVPTIIPTKCRDSRATRRGESESRQTSRHFGGISKTGAGQEANPAKYPAILAGYPASLPGHFPGHFVRLGGLEVQLRGQLGLIRANWGLFKRYSPIRFARRLNP